MAERRVAIVGDVVRRPAKPWTATVHSILAHLHAQGLPVPEPLGVERGADGEVELVHLVPGDAGNDSWRHQLSLPGVRSAGTLMRRMHDATRTWVRPDDAVWSAPTEGGDVVCHGDVQPANLAWRDGRAVGLFDGDGARPAEPLSDVAHALEWFTPFETDPVELARRGFTAPPPRRERIAALLDGCGWEEPLDVVDVVPARQQLAIDEVVHLARGGHEPHMTWAAQGWPRRWRAKLDVTRSLAPEVVRRSA